MKPNRQTVWGDIEQTVRKMCESQGLDVDRIDRETSLEGTLGFSSVESIHLMISLEDHFAKELNLEELVMKEGRYVSDLLLGELHDFVCAKLQLPSAG